MARKLSIGRRATDEARTTSRCALKAHQEQVGRGMSKLSDQGPETVYGLSSLSVVFFTRRHASTFSPGD